MMLFNRNTSHGEVCKTDITLAKHIQTQNKESLPIPDLNPKLSVYCILMHWVLSL